MNTAIRFLCAGLLLCAVAAQPAFAKGKGGDKPAEDTPTIDEDTIAGEVFFHSNVEYMFPKFTLDGKEWDNTEVVDKRRTLVIRGVDRKDEHTFILTPQAGYEAQTITIKPADFKKTVIKQKGSTKTLAFRATYKLDFVKAADAGAKKDATGK